MDVSNAGSVEIEAMESRWWLSALPSPRRTLEGRHRCINCHPPSREAQKKKLITFGASISSKIIIAETSDPLALSGHEETLKAQHSTLSPCVLSLPHSPFNLLRTPDCKMSESALGAITTIIAVGETAAQALGAPVAAGLAQEIVRSCEDVARHKKHASMLGIKSVHLSQALEEAMQEGPGLEGTKMQERIDEVEGVLRKVRDRVDKWAKMSIVVRWWRRNEIQNGIELCSTELETAIQIFTLKAHISEERKNRLARSEAQQNDLENKEMLRQILANQANLMQVAQLHEAGEPIATAVMEEGQQELRNLRSNQGQGKFPTGSRSGKRYLDMQRGLMNLHDLTKIPPTIKVLDGEITREGEIAIAGGTSSDIWRGRWMGQKPVALKTMRSVNSQDKRAQKVSPWLENGNVLEYVLKHPDADLLHLLRGAAEGLSYLHSQDIVHGNIKCSNILVYDSGEACISDFGMAKVLEDVTKTSASTTLQSMGCARWMAPEIVEGDPPSKASDTYSFAMAILELLTKKHPLSELKNDIAVIRTMAQSKAHEIRPTRPTDDVVKQWLTDELWSLMQQCWQAPEQRPTMEIVSTQLQEIQCTDH
ncbi:hypothetical protein NP233_g10763 [Leucocoprinus birnbaumii]|uniref:Protein kinase domain-containing protein n=1 Tax=Leucocoprinus birnbaumii TaxID=56174 RepID=A0AAD5YLV6_9AGAR|nr:hypothetical protein NP233_g10763 [Leucocoprinus birnbaumii]